MKMKNRHDKFCKCGGFANKKHKCGPFFLTRAGDAKQKINLTWPKNCDVKECDVTEEKY